MTQSPEFAEIGRLLPVDIQAKERAIDDMIYLVNLAIESGHVRGDLQLVSALRGLAYGLPAFRKGFRLIAELARDHNLVVNVESSAVVSMRALGSREN